MSNSPETQAPLLVATDIHKSYKMGRRSLDVLRGVSLEVYPGDFLAIRGASGAGKSTFLHVLGGLDRPSQGDVTFDGRQLSRFSSSELASFRNRRVGFVFQAYHLLPELTALENACLPARMQRTPHRQAHQRAASLLRRVGLGDRLDHRPYELSGGEQQRVALARSLVNQPDLLLADEPTGNLDSHTGGEIIALLAELQQEYRLTLVIATHDSRVADQAPRIITLVDGRVGD